MTLKGIYAPNYAVLVTQCAAFPKRRRPVGADNLICLATGTGLLKMHSSTLMCNCETWKEERTALEELNFSWLENTSHTFQDPKTTSRDQLSHQCSHPPVGLRNLAHSPPPAERVPGSPMVHSIRETVWGNDHTRTGNDYFLIKVSSFRQTRASRLRTRRWQSDARCVGKGVRSLVLLLLQQGGSPPLAVVRRSHAGAERDRHEVSSRARAAGSSRVPRHTDMWLLRQRSGGVYGEADLGRWVQDLPFPIRYQGKQRRSFFVF